MVFHERGPQKDPTQAFAGRSEIECWRFIPVDCGIGFYHNLLSYNSVLQLCSDMTDLLCLKTCYSRWRVVDARELITPGSW